MNSSSQPSPAVQKCFGLIRRKQVWALTWRGRLLLLLVLLTGGLFLLLTVHPFLAVNAPIDTSILVLEGWATDYVATGYVASCSSETMIFTVGGPTTLNPKSLNVSDTYASVARGQLLSAGIPASRVQMVPCRDAQRDRTFSSAIALRDWCRTNHVELRAINVATSGTHARRSRLLFQKAFGSGVKVGIISLPKHTYDGRRWWRFSEGFKDVISEGAAYLYVRFLFSPVSVTQNPAQSQENQK